MKYPAIITSTLTSLYLLASNSAVATQSSDASDEQARWFEIEVILFKHVTGHSTNQKSSEQFSAIDLDSKKHDAIDLLAPYLQPDIASLKQLLPNCEQAAPLFPYHITPAALWVDEQESNGVDESTHIQTANTQAAKSQATNADNASIENSAAAGSLTKTFTEPSAEAESKGYTASSIQLPVYNHYPITSQTPLCVIPAEFFQQHLTSAQLDRFAIDGFAIESMPNSIDALEQWQDDDTGQITWASEQPYLISNDSLRLHSIVNRIKWSRDYAPLIHLGWRQTGESNRQATAVQLYAGKHLELAYQQAKIKQEAEQLALEIQTILTQAQQEQSLITKALAISSTEDVNTATNTTTHESELTITEKLHVQAQQQQLNTLYEQFTLLSTKLIDPTTEPSNNMPVNEKNNDVNDKVDTFESIQNERAIKAIVAELSTDITSKAAQLSTAQSSNSPIALVKPSQAWSIDGLFKVHLDHYLYINSEFTIIDESAKSLTSKSSTSSANAKHTQASEHKVISFKQNRRVITGEIHYFDHPHIGMVVQIRRFDPSAPADEAVTQAKNNH